MTTSFFERKRRFAKLCWQHTLNIGNVVDVNFEKLSSFDFFVHLSNRIHFRVIHETRDTFYPSSIHWIPFLIWIWSYLLLICTIQCIKKVLLLFLSIQCLFLGKFWNQCCISILLFIFSGFFHFWSNFYIFCRSHFSFSFKWNLSLDKSSVFYTRPRKFTTATWCGQLFF